MRRSSEEASSRHNNWTLLALGAAGALLLMAAFRWGDRLVSIARGHLDVVAVAAATAALAAASYMLARTALPIASRLTPALGGFVRRHGFSSYLLVALPIAAASVWLTFAPRGLSVFAAAAGKVALWAFFLALYDKLILTRVDTFGKIAAGDLAVGIHSGLAALAIGLCVALA